MTDDEVLVSLKKFDKAVVSAIETLYNEIGERAGFSIAAILDNKIDSFCKVKGITREQLNAAMASVLMNARAKN